MQQPVVMVPQQQPMVVMQQQQPPQMVVQQPQVMMMQQQQPVQAQAPQEWRYGLFSCFDDIGTCLYGCLCGPCLIGDNGGKMGRSCFGDCCTAYLCINFLGGDCFGPTVTQRTDIRRRANLQESGCGECMVGWCCFPCAACQHANEIKFRTSQGVNMALG